MLIKTLNLCFYESWKTLQCYRIQNLVSWMNFFNSWYGIIISCLSPGLISSSLFITDLRAYVDNMRNRSPSRQWYLLCLANVILHFAFSAWQNWAVLTLSKWQHSLTHGPVYSWEIHARNTVVIFTICGLTDSTETVLSGMFYLALERRILLPHGTECCVRPNWVLISSLQTFWRPEYSQNLMVGMSGS